MIVCLSEKDRSNNYVRVITVSKITAFSDSFFQNARVLKPYTGTVKDNGTDDEIAIQTYVLATGLRFCIRYHLRLGA